MDSKYEEKVQQGVEEDFIQKLSHISYTHFENNAFHQCVNRAQSAGAQFGKAVYAISTIFRIIITTIMYGILLSKISILFPLVIIVSILLSLGFSGFITDKQLNYWRSEVAPHALRYNYFQKLWEDQINVQNIKANRLYDYFYEEFSSVNKKYRNSTMRLNLFSLSSELIPVLLQTIVFTATVLYVAIQVMHHRVDVGYFAMTLTLLANFYSMMKSNSYFFLQENMYVKTLSDYFDIIDQNETYLLEASRKNNVQVCQIRYINLEYKYPQSDHMVLTGVNACAKIGKVVAVVGLNGSGKTTLMNITMGLLEGYTGHVFFDDYDGNTLAPINMQNAIGMLTQDFGQYQMTVRENILYGQQSEVMNDDQLYELLELVGMKSTVQKLKKGLDTPLGQLENGIEFSKGQWQRIGVARLLANPERKIWILDEPTAHLDPIAEIEIYSLIQSLAEGRLVFFISHRLGFTRTADVIWVIDNGRIIEKGTHEQLLQDNGYYADMYKAQAEWYF
jgi:ABC-type bacteriocin/lantibiotic exporters, contain an N-terminal double-glycine peptidase domain